MDSTKRILVQFELKKKNEIQTLNEFIWHILNTSDI